MPRKNVDDKADLLPLVTANLNHSTLATETLNDRSLTMCWVSNNCQMQMKKIPFLDTHHQATLVIVELMGWSRPTRRLLT